jgi:hypothetical protein
MPRACFVLIFYLNLCHLFVCLFQFILLHFFDIIRDLFVHFQEFHKCYKGHIYT